MILDDIIAALVGIFQALFEGVAIMIEPLVNLIAAGIEAVVGLFVSGFELGRMKRKKPRSRGSTITGLLTLLMLVSIFGWFFVVPKVMNRTVTFIATDGHSLTYAGLMIHTKDGAKHQRTDSSGEIVIPRFTTKSITINDARYVEQTWERAEIGPTLTVQRSVLGSGLDKLSDRLRRSAKE